MARVAGPASPEPVSSTLPARRCSSAAEAFCAPSPWVRDGHGSAMRLVDPQEWPRVVAVVGGGRMGSGIAEAFAAGGLEVRITDATPELSAAACERVVTRARSAVEQGLVDAGAVCHRRARRLGLRAVGAAARGAPDRRRDARLAQHPWTGVVKAAHQLDLVGAGRGLGPALSGGGRAPAGPAARRRGVARGRRRGTRPTVGAAGARRGARRGHRV